MSFSPVLAGESGTYNRAEPVFFWKVRTFTWEWELSSDVALPGPAIRLLIDGQPATPYVTSTTRKYMFSLANIANGHHIAQGATSSGPIAAYAKSFVINDTGAPLSDPKPYAATNRFETMYPGNYPVPGPVGAVQVPYATKVPVYKPLKPRAILKSSELRPKNKRWVRMITANNYAMLTRKFVTVPPGDIVIEADQKYFYNDATTKGGAFKAGLETPKVTMRDGPRGVHSLGYVYKFIVRRGGKVAYFFETNGRFGVFCLEDITTLPEPGADMTKHVMPKKQGDIVTLAGWRVKPGRHKAHGAMKSSNYQYRTDATHKAYYDDQWEMLGDWSQVPGIHLFSEPWGFCVARLMPDGSFDDRDGLDGWLCDTLNHRMLYGDMWPTHGAFYRKTRLGPVGYVPPQTATGRMHFAHFAGNTNSTPLGRLVNEPWDSAFDPRTGKVYWTNYGGNSISRSNYDGTQQEIVLACSVNPTDAQLGVPQRLEWAWPTTNFSPSSVEETKIWPYFLKDGPVGTATCCRPQAIAFDSAGKLIWVERYTYAVRELDLTTMQVKTITKFKSNRGSSSASTNDVAMWIDTEATCSPKDTIYLSGWAYTDLWFLRDGSVPDADADGATWDDRQWATSGSASSQMSNGPQDKCFASIYAWGLGGGDGKILYSGNGAGWQCQEVTHRLPTDPEPDLVKWKDGSVAYRNAAVFTLTHGPLLQGELGYPTADEMGGWSEQQLRDYATQWGIPNAQVPGRTYTHVDAFLYFVRWQSRDADYTIVEEEDPVMIAELQAALAAAQAALTNAQNELSTLQTESDAKDATIATLTGEKAALQTKLNNARTAAEAEKAADAAHVAGQGVLDALS